MLKYLRLHKNKRLKNLQRYQKNLCSVSKKALQSIFWMERAQSLQQLFYFVDSMSDDEDTEHKRKFTKTFV